MDAKITASWLFHPSTQAVFAALNSGHKAGTSQAGIEDMARAVGGCVRDSILGDDSARVFGSHQIDVDIATMHRPEVATSLLTDAGFKVIPTGIAHGTITAVSPSSSATDGMAFEVTTLRRDVSTDGRHAEVAWSRDWTEDAARRDFTINALYADSTGIVYDPLGTGLDDLAAGRVRFIGDSGARISEDYLRVLRFFRFHYRFAASRRPDEAGFSACVAAADSMGNLSGERLWRELGVILTLPDCGLAIAVMDKAGIFSKMMPKVAFPFNHARFCRLVDYEEDALFRCDPLLRLMALLPDSVVSVRRVAARLKLSNAEKSRLVRSRSMPSRSDMPPLPAIVAHMSAREARRALYLLGASFFADRVMLAWSAAGHHHNDIQWRALLALSASWVLPHFPLTGQMLQAAGIPQGEMMGKIARLVEAWWIDTDFIDDEFSIIERLKAITQALIY